MKNDHYLASLLPTFSKERVLEDCRLTRAEIVDVSLPLYKTALNAFKGYKFKNEELQNFQEVFGRMVKGHKGGLLEGIHSALQDTVENLDEIVGLIDQVYNDDVAGAGLSYLKANLLQFTEWTSFESRYSRKLLIYILISETSMYPDSGTTISESLEPAEVEWIKVNFVHFCTAVNVVAQPKEKLKAAVSLIPDIAITKENIGTLKATMGESKIDPFAVGLIPIWLNPIYHVRMIISEWQAERYVASKEEKKLIELRVLNLKRVQNGKPDAATQKEIEYSESRLSKINYKLQKMEKTQ